MFRDAGLLTVVAAAFAGGPLSAAVAVASGAAVAWVSPFVFEASALTAVLLGACVLVDGPGSHLRLSLAVAGGFLLCLGALYLEPAGPLAAGVLMALTAVPCLAAVRLRDGDDLRLPLVVSASLLAVCASGLLALANGTLIVNSGHRPDELTPAARDIWWAARDRTPPGALIFTDQTGTEQGLLGGWNTFCMIAGRQVFVGPVLQSRLRFDLAAQRLRMAQNELVLRGELGRTDLPALAGYDGWYTVLDRGRPVPAGFRLCYENSTYSLYAIRGSGRDGRDPACREK
jgi:hypothetical protein